MRKNATKQGLHCKCKECQQEYIYDRLKGHRLDRCGTCYRRESNYKLRRKRGVQPRKRLQNPNLVENYFETIDTLEKAYWLGFLYADGYVTRNHRGLQIQLATKDEGLLDKFINAIGGNLENKRYYEGYEIPGKRVEFRFSNPGFVSHLVDNGCVTKKSKVIRLPNFDCQKLDLAFLSGYYDGDGLKGSSAICCGSMLFLEDIKSKHGIDFKIRLGNQKGTVFTLSLGAPLFKNMMNNYPDSLERKRKIITT